MGHNITMAYGHQEVWIGLGAYPEEFEYTLEGQFFVDTGFSNTGKPNCIVNYTESREDQGQRLLGFLLLLLILGQLQNNSCCVRPNI